MEYQNKEEMPYEVNQTNLKDEFDYEYIIIGFGWFLLIIGIITVLLGLYIAIYVNDIPKLILGFVLIILGLVLFQIGRLLKRSKYKEVEDFKYTLKSILSKRH